MSYISQKGGCHGHSNPSAAYSPVQGAAPRLPATAGAEGSSGSTRPRLEPSATAQASAGPPRPPRSGLHTSDLPSFRPPRRRRDPDPRRTYDLQPAPLPGRLGPREPLQLSPRLLAQPLELLASGAEIHPSDPRSIRARGCHRIGG